MCAVLCFVRGFTNRKKGYKKGYREMYKGWNDPVLVKVINLCYIKKEMPKNIL